MLLGVLSAGCLAEPVDVGFVSDVERDVAVALLLALGVELHLEGAALRDQQRSECILEDRPPEPDSVARLHIDPAPRLLPVLLLGALQSEPVLGLAHPVLGLEMGEGSVRVRTSPLPSLQARLQALSALEARSFSTRRAPTAPRKNCSM